MPLKPPRGSLAQMNERELATYFAQAGIQADAKVKTFTPAWTGFSADPSGDLEYMDFGAFVAIWSTAINVGTSDDTNFLITNLPSDIRPRTQFRNVTLMAIDNNVNVSASVSINTTGTMTFQIATVVGAIVTFSGTGWTAASNKGFPAGATMIYTK